MRIKLVGSLFKSLLNTQYGFSAMKYYYLKKRQRIWEPILIILALIPTSIALITGLLQLVDTIYNLGTMLGQPQLVLLLSILTAQIATFILAFSLVVATFYFSNDLKTLIAWPLTPQEVLTAKFATILFSEYLTTLLFIVPVWVYYGLKTSASFLYWLTALLGVLTLPILPLAIATIIVIFLMRLVNISNRKDLLAIIGGFIVLILIFGGQLYLQMKLPQDPQIIMEMLLEKSNGLIKYAGRVFPPSIWLTQSLKDASNITGWGYFGLYIAVTIVSYLLLLALAKRVFYQGVLAGMETGKLTKKKSLSSYEIKTRSPLLSLTYSEMKIFLRTPPFVLNGLVGYVILPVMFIFRGVKINNQPVDLSILTQSLSSQLLVVFVALYFAVMGVMSSIPSTAFSREGKYLWNLRIMPVSAKTSMAAKLSAAQIINVLGSTLGVITVTLFLKLPVLPVLAGMIIGIVFSFAVSGLAIFLDLTRPLLNWTNPAHAMKSNLNTILALIGLAALVIPTIYRVLGHTKAGTINLMILEFLIITVLLAFVTYWIWNRYGEKFYKKM